MKTNEPTCKDKNEILKKLNMEKNKIKTEVEALSKKIKPVKK